MGPKSENGGRPKIWSDSASQSSESDEDRCDRRSLMRLRPRFEAHLPSDFGRHFARHLPVDLGRILCECSQHGHKGGKIMRHPRRAGRARTRSAMHRTSEAAAAAASAFRRSGSRGLRGEMATPHGSLGGKAPSVTAARACESRRSHWVRRGGGGAVEGRNSDFWLICFTPLLEGPP